MLRADDPAGPQQPGGDPLEDPHRVQAVVAGEQRQVRVVVTRLGRDALVGLERDVGRVAQHHVDGPVEVGERLGHVAVAQVDPGTGQVALAQASAGVAQLDGMDLGLGHLGRHAEGDRPGPGAQVDHDRGPARGDDVAGPVDPPAGEQLGLGPRA